MTAATLTRTRPFWLAEPCPAWCERQHTNADRYEDREHGGASVKMPLTLEDTGRVLYATPSRHVLHTDAQIEVYRDGEAGVHMTTAEARAWGRKLVALADATDAGEAVA